MEQRICSNIFGNYKEADSNTLYDYLSSSTFTLQGDSHYPEFPSNVEDDVQPYEQYFFLSNIPSELLAAMRQEETYCGIEARVYLELGM